MGNKEKKTKQKREKKEKVKFHVDLKFTFVIAGIFIVLYGIDTLLMYLFTYNGNFGRLDSFLLAITILASSILIGILASYVVSRFTFSEFKKLSAGMERIAKGDFSVRLDLKLFAETKKISDSFNAMAESLASVEILKDDFIGDFSHEFKTPLSSIRGYVNLLRDEKLSKAKREEYLEIVNDELNRLLELSNNTLLISKLNAQNNLGTLNEVRCGETFKRILLLSEKYIEAKSLNIELNLKPVTIVHNEDLLKQIYMNLISNAIKFSPEGGTIVLGVEPKDEGVLITVKDEGIGMDEATKKRIFDKYFQGDPSHSGQGAGLGLSIVKKIADLSHGTIEVESAPNEGSTFKVYLPSAK